ncbi:hypothetical protein [Polaromonas sp. A23]|uniref:hypothetical protein n=1 Tax=Polaromonas sp. A23 TaxID=1944133 RepID=UPI0009866735|nr:hypothetical protein [Polaromonas sp. A23]OOG36052.1 hypothetical protein B0B52_21050 [Polaromonas sp. A23]
MSLFNWFSGKSHDEAILVEGQRDHDSSGLTRDERTRPVAGARTKTSVPAPLKATVEQSSGQKTQRHAKRELLYAAVREAMIRAGVLSASYKFKVLSLDPRGDQFMVMMDLAQEFGGQTERLAEIEVLIAQSAKARYNIRVTAVYWRMNELVSVGRPNVQTQAVSQPHAAEAATAVAPVLPVPVAVAVAASEPFIKTVVMAAPVEALAAEPEPVVAKPTPLPKRYEPIEDDEVAAFKQALVAASAGGSPMKPEKSEPRRSRDRSYTLLTGFEDTEMPETPVSVPALSATQYGDLI